MPENDRGYGHNGWLDAALDITVVDELPKKVVHSSASTMTVASVPAVAPVATAIALSPDALAGKALFTSGTQPGCGVCHTLADAGSTGAVGPNLDSLDPSLARVETAIKNGVGIMPAFGGQLSATEIAALAAYVNETTR